MPYHITDDDRLLPCKAKKKCRYGGESGKENHFSLLPEARSAHDLYLQRKYGTVPEGLASSGPRSKNERVLGMVLRNLKGPEGAEATGEEPSRPSGEEGAPEEVLEAKRGRRKRTPSSKTPKGPSRQKATGATTEEEKTPSKTITPNPSKGGSGRGKRVPTSQRVLPAVTVVDEARGELQVEGFGRVFDANGVVRRTLEEVRTASFAEGIPAAIEYPRERVTASGARLLDEVTQEVLLQERRRRYRGAYAAKSPQEGRGAPRTRQEAARLVEYLGSRGIHAEAAEAMEDRFFHEVPRGKELPAPEEITGVQVVNGTSSRGFPDKPVRTLWLSPGREDASGKIVTGWKEWGAANGSEDIAHRTVTHEAAFAPHAVIVTLDEASYRYTPQVLDGGAAPHPWTSNQVESYAGGFGLRVNTPDGRIPNCVDWEGLRRAGVSAVRVRRGNDNHFYGWDEDSIAVLAPGTLLGWREREAPRLEVEQEEDYE